MGPVYTGKRLQKQLTALGVEAGDVLLVHTAFRKLGHVVGGPQVLVEALLACLGDDGTLVMPTHTASNTEPGNWQNPPVPPQTWARVRDALPAFRSDRTPSQKMGVVAETFRAWPGALRSDHPVASFCACGAHAEGIITHTPLEDMFGESSPLGRLARLRAQVLLLGVGYDKCTMLHLAEHRSGLETEGIDEGSAVWKKGARVWLKYKIRAYSSDDFEACGAAYEQLGRHHEGRIGAARAKLLDSTSLLDFAADWLRQKRSAACD